METVEKKKMCECCNEKKVIVRNRAEYDYTLAISRIRPFSLYSVPCFSHRLIGLLVSITVACHFILKEHPST
jgi:hypothetical protein